MFFSTVNPQYKFGQQQEVSHVFSQESRPQLGYLGFLKKDTIVGIFSRLGLEELSKLRVTSKSFHQLTRHPEILRAIAATLKIPVVHKENYSNLQIIFRISLLYLQLEQFIDVSLNNPQRIVLKNKSQIKSIHKHVRTNIEDHCGLIPKHPVAVLSEISFQDIKPKYPLQSEMEDLLALAIKKYPCGSWLDTRHSKLNILRASRRVFTLIWKDGKGIVNVENCYTLKHMVKKILALKLSPIHEIKWEWDKEQPKI